ncbi:MAG: hypothetical protein IJF65_00965 [Clostridia bacterium]|nr:hypothetical protein [Clostridia bacterium]
MLSDRLLLKIKQAAVSGTVSRNEVWKQLAKNDELSPDQSQRQEPPSPKGHLASGWFSVGSGFISGKALDL